MGARIRALLLLLGLLGGALVILVHLSVTLLGDHQVRQNQRRTLDLLAAVTASATDRGRGLPDLDAFASELRQITRARLWLVRERKGRPAQVAPSLDARPVRSTPDLLDGALGAAPGTLLCDLPADFVPGGRICRTTLPGRGSDVAVLIPARSFAADVSRYRRILGIVAAVAWLLLGIAGHMAFTWFFVRPLGRTVRAMERTASSERSPYLEPSGAPEFQAIAQAFNRMVKTRQDATQRIAFQLEGLQLANEELGLTRKSLVRSEQLAQVGVLAAGIAHEIGNPLGIVAGYLEMLRDGELSSAEEARYISRAERALERIQVILRNLLDFSRRDADVDRPRAGVAAVATRVVELVRPQKRFRRIQIRLDLDPDLPPVAMAPGRLEQVLINLLMNAADAAGAEGLVVVRSRSDGALVCIDVDDNGPGIPEDLRGRVFEPFVTSKAAGEGTGLGLFVCRHLVTAYGGEIRVGALSEGGTRFELRLWAAEDGPPASPDPEAPEAPAAPEPT